jgi:PAS domain S-box-containing protein
MSVTLIRILLVEDDPNDIFLIKRMLNKFWNSYYEFRIDQCGLLSEAMKYLNHQEPDVILLDLGLPDSNGLQILTSIIDLVPSIPIVVLTGLEDEDVAIEALQQGAQDYLIKGQVERNLLARSLRYAIERKGATEELKKLILELQESEARFKTTFEDAPIGISLVDLNGRLLDTNLVFQRMLGYSSEELGHMAFCKLSHPEDAPRCIKLFKEMITGKRDSYRIDYERYLRKDGGLIWTRLQVSVVKDASGEPYFAIGMIEDITKQKQSEDEILAYQERLRSLASELTLVEERERRRIAIQLHENIGQILAFARIKLGTLIAEAATSAIAADLNEVRNQIDQTILFTRSLTFELSPPILYELSFGDAVQWLANQFQENYGAEIEVQQEPHPTPLTDDMKILLFLMVRELLTNVAEHAQAHHAKVVITKEGDRLRIQVEDDGVGFNVAKSGAVGFGLFSIRERLDHIGGHLKVKSKPGHGTLVTMTIPLMPEDH